MVVRPGTRFPLPIETCGYAGSDGRTQRLPDARGIEQAIHLPPCSDYSAIIALEAHNGCASDARHASDLSAVCCSAGPAWHSGPTPLPTEVQERFQLLTQRRIIAGFGLTECAPLTHSATVDGQAKPGSIGRLLPATAGRIVDPITRRELRFDGRNQGELLIRGPQVMPGYWQRPAMTGHAIDTDGWLHIGLLCTADGDGDFFITGHVGDIAGRTMML